MRLLVRSLTTVAVIVIASGVFILAMETYQWSQEPSTTATIQAVVIKCAMSYRAGKGTGKTSIVTCDQVDTVKRNAPDLDWTVRKVKVATLSYRSGDGKLVFGDYALSRLNLTDARVGDHVTVYYRPGNPKFIKGPPNLTWFLGLSRLLGLGIAILIGAWGARWIANWLLTEEERLAVEAIRNARSSGGWDKGFRDAAVMLPLFLFGRIFLYLAGIVMVFSGLGFGLSVFTEKASLPATATVSDVRAICTMSYKSGRFSSVEKTVPCEGVAAEKAKLPQVQWRVERRSEIALAYVTADGKHREARETTGRSSDRVPAVGEAVAIRYYANNPTSVTLADDDLTRSLGWIFGVSAGFFMLGLVVRPFLKRAQAREAADFRAKAEDELHTLVLNKAMEDADFLKGVAARAATEQQTPAQPRGGFGRRASA